MDNGYFSGGNREIREESHHNTYIATDKNAKKNKEELSESTRRVEKSDFDYNETNSTTGSDT